MRLRPAIPCVALAAAAAVAAVIGYSTKARSADHQDGPAVKADPPSDINDVFSWMDGSNVVLAMTVYPAAPMGALFGDTTQYVFHTYSGSAFGMATNNVDVIATFDSSTPQKIQLWVGANEYVTGDASATTGISSADGKVKVYAGVRADPFFFNLDGFKSTATVVEGAASSLKFDPLGCPTIDMATSGALVKQLGSAPDGGAAENHFATFNGLSIVVSVDKSLLTAGGPVMSVWGGTYK